MFPPLPLQVALVNLVAHGGVGLSQVVIGEQHLAPQLLPFLRRDRVDGPITDIAVNFLERALSGNFFSPNSLLRARFSSEQAFVRKGVVARSQSDTRDGMARQRRQLNIQQVETLL